MERIECLNSKRLARRWGLSHRTLERWRHKGTGPTHLKIGGRILYRRSGNSPVWGLPGIVSLVAFAWLLTLIDSDYAGRAYAA